MSSRQHNVDVDRIALGIKQPWIELILRGVKTLEIRSQPTQQRGTIYLYASKRPAQHPAAVEAAQRYEIDFDSLSYGALLGTIEIVGCRPCRAADHRAACVPAALLARQFAWELVHPVRFAAPLPVRFLPYGVWFYPLKRR